MSIRGMHFENENYVSVILLLKQMGDILCVQTLANLGLSFQLTLEVFNLIHIL